MRARATLVATSLLVAGGAGLVSTASAAPKAKPAAVKPVCNLVVDDKGDSGVAATVPGADGDDIVSGDISSNATTVTAVIRMAAVPAADPMAPNGRSYIFDFSAAGAEAGLFLSARTHPTGTTFVYGFSGVDPTTSLNTSYTIGAATGVVDAAKGEVRISAPVKGFVDSAKAKMTKGAKLSGLGARVFRQASQTLVPSQEAGGVRVPLSGLNVLLDEATGVAGYTMSAPSCLPVGK